MTWETSRFRPTRAGGRSPIWAGSGDNEPVLTDGALALALDFDDADTASAAAFLRPKNRVRDFPLDEDNSAGENVLQFPYWRLENDAPLRQIASAPCFDPTTGQFLSRDPAVARTMSPYAYGAGSPLDNADPSGMIDQSYLSQGQIDQINGMCAGWQRESMCTQAAFCAEWTTGLGSSSGGSCHAIAQIAADNYNTVESAICASNGGDVNLNGYIESQAAAQRDLVEMKTAFQTANQSIDFYNGTNVCKAHAAAAAVAIIGGGGVGVEAYGGVSALATAGMAAAPGAIIRQMSKPPGLNSGWMGATAAGTITAGASLLGC